MLKPAPTAPPSSRKAPSGSATPPSLNVARIELWDKSNLEANIQIYMTLQYKIASLMADQELVSELWSGIHVHFDSQGLPAVATVAHKLWHYQILPDQDMATQVQEIKNMAIKLKSLGYPLSEEFQTIAILTTLSEWNTICNIILNKTRKISLQATIDALMSKDTSNPWETYFYLDSAALNHICHTQDYFSSYWKLGSPRRIKTANGYSNAIGIGDICHNSQWVVSHVTPVTVA